MTQLVLSSSASKRSWPWLTLLAAGGGVALLVLIWGLSALWGDTAVAIGGGQFSRVVPMDLEIKLVKDGELQALNNIEIISEVEGQTTIQQLVKEGSKVSKGDILVVLDSSSIRQKVEDTTLEVQKAEADVVNSRELRDIQESKNATDLEAAGVALALAKLDLKDYEEAAYPQLLDNAQTDLSMAEIDLKNRREDLAQTRNLFAKGFVTAADVKKSELEVTKADNALEKADTALKRLIGYTHASDLAAKQNALSQAEQKLNRVRRENASQMSLRRADVDAKEANLDIIKRRLLRLQQQADACTIKAPAEGMVVYTTSGDRNAQNMIQEGANVRERQSMLRLPDTSSMKAVLRAQESQVPRLREGQRAIVKIVGIPQPVGATLAKISVLADSGQRWWNPDTKEFPVDLVLDQTPAGLKPGMGVTAEVLISRETQVLAVPLGTVYSVGARTFVFVRSGGDVKPTEVTLGAANETHAHLIKGLSGGEDVLQLERGQGQQLLERAGMKIEPATQPGGGFDRRGGPGGQQPNGDRPRRNRDGNGAGNTAAPQADGAGAPGDRPRRNRDGAGQPPVEQSPGK